MARVDLYIHLLALFQLVVTFPFLTLKRQTITNIKLLSHTSFKTADNNEVNPLLIKLVSFNVLAPCYNRIHNNSELESTFKDKYLARNSQICEHLLATQADIICLQEYWTDSDDLKDLYKSKLSNTYEIYDLPRTSHWHHRDDGLAVLVKRDRLLVQDYKEILFHDCGDRVAQLVLLGLKLPGPTQSHEVVMPGPIENTDCDGMDATMLTAPSYGHFLCVNTHLLFPHNKYSTKIRVREASKLLDFLESYRQRELCDSICGRSDVRLPIIIAGDFNGQPKGEVFHLMCSQNYRSAQEDVWPSTLTPRSIRVPWVSHKSHENKIIPVDHVFYLNPSDQVEERLPVLPDWTNLVFRELKQRVLEIFGKNVMMDIFAVFDQDGSEVITREEFATTMKQLGFQGVGTDALTTEEIEALIDSADTNGDGQIDYKEFCSRFLIAEENIEQPPARLTSRGVKGMRRAFQRAQWLLTKDVSYAHSTSLDSVSAYDEKADRNDGARLRSNDNESQLNDSLSTIVKFEPLGDISVSGVTLFPKELESGIWPGNYTWSDHGVVEVTFLATQAHTF